MQTNMATNPKKKGGKDSDKKSVKKSEDSTVVEEPKKEGTLVDELQGSKQDELSPEPETPALPEPTPEPVYEEPVLTLLIVEEYMGEKEKGLYEGCGTAFFVGGHIYEGIFHEGLMHGKGIYKWADGLTYEGDFSRNRVTGKGIYTWPDGSVYDGEVLSGLRHGFGTFRCSSGKMSYTGEWVKGQRHGKGRMDYDPEGVSFYEGDWVENTRHGWGTRRYPSGNIYQGMWFNNLRHGDGNMRWLNSDQMYNGQWQNGVQHGYGQHIWFLKRVAGSQYPLRNMYDGEFVKGQRQGHGVFFYANGAKYDGKWQANAKHGQGKFTFKNGRIYEGVFERDHIVEFPDFQMDGVTTPDLTQIRTRTPLPIENASVHSNESHNTYSPSFQLEVNHVLEEFPEESRTEEASQVLFVMMRYMTGLRKMYHFYSSLGYDESPDNTFVMTRLQFWRFLKDIRLHWQDTTLAEMDRYLGYGRSADELHNPYSKVLFRDFNNYLVVLAYRVYGPQFEDQAPVLANCLSHLMSENILKNACLVKGHMYKELRRAVNALVHTDQTYEIFTQILYPRKSGLNENSMKMRDFLFFMKDLGLINADLTTKAIIDILASDDPKVADDEGACNMELELTFLEFFEALVGCAQVYVTEAVVKDPNTPRASTALTREQSYLSMPASPSRMASQTGGDDGTGEERGSADGTKELQDSDAQGATTASPALRSASQMTGKTASTKPTAGGGGTTVGADGNAGASSSDAAGAAGRQSHNTQHPDSAKKSEATLAQQGKSTSFVSDAGGVSPMPEKSALSLAQSEGAEREGEEYGADYEVEDLDESTKQFNFWTHQLHIFFVRKFLPAAHKMLFLRGLVRQRFEAEEAKKKAAEAQASREITTSRVNTQAQSERAAGAVEPHGFAPVIEEDETAAASEKGTPAVPPIQVHG